MTKAELGTKRTDPETGRKFYDLGKNPIVSPYTGTSYPLSFFEAPSGAPSRYAVQQANRPVHREEGQDEESETQDDEGDTVSLSDIEDDEDASAGGKPGAAVDVDDDEDEDTEKDDDAFLALDETDDADGVENLVGERDEED